MATTMDWYKGNPLTHRDRRLGKSASVWARSFACEDLRPLIVCRGPIRKEAMDVFEEMGITHYGILLSEKDSIVFANALAPELRQLTDTSRVHRVPDYTGASKEERVERMNQIVQIAKDNGYDSVFAGYGFMAEDEEFVATLERAGLKFIGPNSGTQARAGKKDEAKRTAVAVGVSTTPGVNNVTARTLVAKHKTRDAILAVAKAHELALDAKVVGNAKLSLEDLADHVLTASYAKGLDLYTIDELGEQVRREVAEMFGKFPQSRVRLKAIGGGGGKGQRILGGSLLAVKSATPRQIEEAAADAPALTREVLNEVKATGVGDNKNVLIELNIEQTRHNEIQLLGNGKWCISLGGRDCSLQMHEQKLLEISVTQEALAAGIAKAEKTAKAEEAAALKVDLEILKRMEDDAARFGAAVGLDSASTFECIVDRDRYYFMEVNTRIQVEHRVTELCYTLRFTNPADPKDAFVVESLVEAMALLARHGVRLPKPERVARFPASAEARLNATDASLSPHAGGAHPLLVEADRGRDPRRPGPQHAEPRHGHVHALQRGGRVRLEHRAPAHERRGPARELHPALEGPRPDEPARREPRDEPPVPLRARQLVHRAERDRQADDPLRRALPHARRPAEGRGEQARHRVRLPGDEEALRREDGGGGAERPLHHEGDVGRDRPEVHAAHPGHGQAARGSAPALRLAEPEPQELPDRERKGGLGPQSPRRAQRHVRVPEHGVEPEEARRRGHLAARPRAAPAGDPLLPGAPQDVRPAQGGVLQARRDPEERGAPGRLRRGDLGQDPGRAPRLRGGERAARPPLHARGEGELLRLPRGAEPRRHHPRAPARPRAPGPHEEGARAAAVDEGGRARCAVRRHVLPPGGAGPSAVRIRGPALRQGPGALHHRGHEDVQHRARAVLRHDRQDRHERQRR